jgi:hypothetical protein
VKRLAPCAPHALEYRQPVGWATLILLPFFLAAWLRLSPNQLTPPVRRCNLAPRAQTPVWPRPGSKFPFRVLGGAGRETGVSRGAFPSK